jgi:hypothetical protein
MKNLIKMGLVTLTGLVLSGQTCRADLIRADPADKGPPEASIQPVPIAYVGHPVPFQGSATDPDGPKDIVSIQWDFNYDGQNFNPDAAAAGTLRPSHDFTVPGMYTVALQVTDRDGNVALDTITVTVHDVPEPSSVIAFGIGISLLVACNCLVMNKQSLFGEYSRM